MPESAIESDTWLVPTLGEHLGCLWQEQAERVKLVTRDTMARTADWAGGTAFQSGDCRAVQKLRRIVCV